MRLNLARLPLASGVAFPASFMRAEGDEKVSVRAATRGRTKSETVESNEDTEVTCEPPESGMIIGSHSHRLLRLSYHLSPTDLAIPEAL